jgi:hypothetical protein
VHGYEVYVHEVYPYEMRAIEMYARTVWGETSGLLTGGALIDLSIVAIISGGPFLMSLKMRLRTPTPIVE